MCDHIQTAGEVRAACGHKHRSRKEAESLLGMISEPPSLIIPEATDNNTICLLLDSLGKRF